MSVSEVSIANSALVKVGADRISSLTQETKSARLLNAIFAQQRDAVMSAHPWNFAIKRATLAANATVPDSEWTYQFDKPSDCLRVLEAYTTDIDFVVEGDQILSDESELPVRYIYRNVDPASWSPTFAEALACKLAAEVSYALTQSSALADQMVKAYRAVLAEARSMDGAEGIIKGLEADTWTQSRR
jgi:hypothetical protein